MTLSPGNPDSKGTTGLNLLVLDRHKSLGLLLEGGPEGWRFGSLEGGRRGRASLQRAQILQLELSFNHFDKLPHVGTILEAVILEDLSHF